MQPLTLETLLRDPLTRMVMDADGVSMAEFAAVMFSARQAVVARRVIAERGEIAARDVMAARGTFSKCVAALQRATSVPA
jgi:hypothetical protein